MNSDNREIEVKFKISSLEKMQEQIKSLGGSLKQAVLHERNLRLDDTKGTLTKTNQVLRLRDNGGVPVLTYKAEKKNDKGLADREEIETVTDNFDNTRLILERLGFQIVFIYEKYRSVYRLNDTDLFLDHTPIGDYLEIEGPDGDAIRHSAELLGLNWEDRITKGYRSLFNKWKKETGYPGRDMIFE